jgi:cell division septal protein FtsQ
MGTKSPSRTRKTKRRASSSKTKRRRKRSQRRLGRTYDSALSLPAVARMPARAIAQPLAGLLQGKTGLILGLVLLGLLAASLGYWLFLTDDFYVYEITVQGNRLVSADEIFAASGLYEMSIFWVNPRQAAGTVAGLPGILSAEVHRALPNRVTITVVEREPQVVWQRAGTRWLVDEQGTVLTAQTGPGDGLVIEDQGSNPLHPGDQVDAAAVAGARQLQGLLPELSAVRYTPQTGLSFRHSLGCDIHLGSGTDMAEKVAIMQALVEQLAASGEHPEYIDLRFKGSPCYKLSNE